jgi:hypothetical protein
MNQTWGWLKGGIILGMVFFAAVAIIKPIGVSTQYVIADCLVFCNINPDLAQEIARKDGTVFYKSSNPYLNKSKGKYVKAAKNPGNYGFVFVPAMFVGGWLATKFGHSKIADDEKWIPHVWRENLGSSWGKRMAGAFISGFMILFGARLAGGCTSGHMMSGMMQTSLSGYLFAFGVFAIAVPVSIILFRR